MKHPERLFILLLLSLIFLLGNSAGGLAGLGALVIGAVIGLGAIIAIIWGLIKWLT
jgi:hypothetical protein